GVSELGGRLKPLSRVLGEEPRHDGDQRRWNILADGGQRLRLALLVRQQLLHETSAAKRRRPRERVIQRAAEAVQGGAERRGCGIPCLLRREVFGCPEERAVGRQTGPAFLG